MAYVIIISSLAIIATPISLETLITMQESQIFNAYNIVCLYSA